MSQVEFHRLLDCLADLSPDQIAQLRTRLEAFIAPPTLSFSEAELADIVLQRQLVEAGVLSEIKPPIRDLTPYLDRQAVPIAGEPISETIIRERR